MNKDILALSDLKKGMPGISSIQGTFLQENAMVALHKANHHSPTKTTLTGIAEKDIQLSWEDTVNQQLLNSYNDEKENTEFAAAGISALLTPFLTDYTIIMRAQQGTGFDYWLGKDETSLSPLATLEVSGIKSENSDNTISKRLSAKKKQIMASEGLKLPQYISIVEMAKPKVHYELVTTNANERE